ncbi:MAG: hypothetical protein KC416_03005 [Myxococcales bacterium]|nr:hypothetical protein [Myxococcales bacterium]
MQCLATWSSLLALFLGAAACSPATGNDPTVFDEANGGAADGWFSDPTSIVCPTFLDPEKVGRIEVERAEELSGLAASRQVPGVFWSHNDSDGSGRIFAFDRDGEALAEFKLEGAKGKDWEDVSLGPGPNPWQDYLYIGDIGDNDLERGKLKVYRLPEPHLAPPQEKPEEIGEFEVFRFEYEDDEAHDAEALAIDPITGTLYIATKSQRGDRDTQVFIAQGPFEDGETYTLRHFTDENELDALKGRATAADISENGGRWIMKFDDRVSFWFRRGVGARDWAFDLEPCEGPVPKGQIETVAWDPGGKGYFLVPEGDEPHLFFVGIEN